MGRRFWPPEQPTPRRLGQAADAHRLPVVARVQRSVGSGGSPGSGLSSPASPVGSSRCMSPDTAAHRAGRRSAAPAHHASPIRHSRTRRRRRRVTRRHPCPGTVPSTPTQAGTARRGRGCHRSGRSPPSGYGRGMHRSARSRRDSAHRRARRAAERTSAARSGSRSITPSQRSRKVRCAGGHDGTTVVSGSPAAVHALPPSSTATAGCPRSSSIHHSREATQPPTSS